MIGMDWYVWFDLAWSLADMERDSYNREVGSVDGWRYPPVHVGLTGCSVTSYIEEEEGRLPTLHLS